MQRMSIALAVLLPLFAKAESLTEKVASARPSAAEDRWNSVPWRTNLFRARLDAQAAGKPVLLWVMDGHVLGAT